MVLSIPPDIATSAFPCLLMVGGKVTAGLAADGLMWFDGFEEFDGFEVKAPLGVWGGGLGRGR